MSILISFAGLQTGVDRSGVYTKQISILWYY